MRKYFCAFLILLMLCCCGCSDKQSVGKDNKEIIIPPTSDSVSNLNGYRENLPFDFTASEQSVSNAKYYASISGKKFHTCECAFAKSIKEDNLYKTNDRQELINNGYTPCKKCNP